MLSSLVTTSVICGLFLIRLIDVSEASPPLDYFAIASDGGSNLNSLNDNNTSDLDKQLLKILSNKSHTHDDNLIGKEEVFYAWTRMEQGYKNYISTKVNQSRPVIRELLKESMVSSACEVAIDKWMDSLADLELWAAIMWNSWGNFPPVGLMEGSFTDFGSYHGCLQIPDNKIMGQSQYCTLGFQPLVPTRPRFHSIYKKVLDVDELTGRLTGGDFEPDSLAPAEVSSKLASHTYGVAQKFKRLKGPTVSPKSKRNDTRSNYNLTTSAMAAFARRAQFFYYINLRIGSCWPASCSPNDIQNISRTAATRAVLQANEVHCITSSERKKPKINSYQWSAIIILGSFAYIIFLASFLDQLCFWLIYFGFKELATKLSKFLDIYLESCSLQRNLSKLFSIAPTTPVTATATTSGAKQEKKSAKQLSCLHGLRFMSMIWVIYGHTLLNAEYQAFTHAFEVLDNSLGRLVLLPSLITNFSVDNFFLISGLLSSYIIFSLNVKFNGFLYTAARYVRLTPQMLIVVLMIFLLPLMGDGPFYRQSTQVHAENCFKNFWLNIFYVQTYFNRTEMCLIPSWWLSVEMTFHLISLVVIYKLIQQPKLGMAINFFIIAVLSAVGYVVHYNYGLAIQYLPSMPQRYEVEIELTQRFFHRPYPHAASYFIGLALGYVLAKRCIVTLQRKHLYAGWFVCIAGFGITSWLPYFWNLGAPYTQLQASLYYNTCQILWPVSISWIILTCSLGYGGPLDTFLSAKFFVPLGRITYMTYLSHMVIVYFFAASPHHTLEPNLLNFLYICISNIVLSLGFGTILSLIYEAPILNIQRLVLKKMYEKVEVTVVTPTDTNGLSNQLIIEAEAEPETKKKSTGRYSYRKTLITDDTKN